MGCGGSKAEDQPVPTPSEAPKAAEAEAPATASPARKGSNVSSDEMAAIRAKMAAAKDDDRPASVPFKAGDKSTHKVRRASDQWVKGGETDAINQKIGEAQEKKVQEAEKPKGHVREQSRKMVRALTRGKSSSNMLRSMSKKSSKGLLRGISRRNVNPPSSAMERGVMAAKQKIARERGIASAAAEPTSEPPPDAGAATEGMTALERGTAKAKAKVSKEPKAPARSLSRRMMGASGRFGSSLRSMSRRSRGSRATELTSSVHDHEPEPLSRGSSSGKHVGFAADSGSANVEA